MERRGARPWAVLWLLGAALMGMASSLTLQHIASAQGEQRINTVAIEKKLDEILANQGTILQKLDTVMGELQVVKVRCTR